MLWNHPRSYELDWILSRPTLLQVSVKGSLSANGVSQGSVLSLILFIIDVNDLTDILTIDHLLYNYDVELIALPRKLAASLQSSLVASSKWSDDWELIFNPAKSERLPVGDISNPATYSLTSRTSPNARPIQAAGTVRDLGLFLNTGFSADVNVAHVIKKSAKCFFYLKRPFVALTASTILPFSKVLIRPHLEYATKESPPFSLWTPRR